MKKKLLAILAMAIVVVFALTACGGSSGGGASGGGANGGGANNGGAAETYDTGSFTVAVPSGWNAIPQKDMLGEKDENGDYPVDPNSILIAKGVTDEYAAYSAPMVRITYYPPSSILLDSRSFYDDVKEISDATINGATCDAFSGVSLGYLYDFITYETDKGSFQFNVLEAVDDKATGITWQDPDVMAIMESIAAK